MEKLLKHKEKIFLFLLLIAAAFLRLYRIGDYMTFLGDEGRDVLVVYNILHGHLTLLGPTASVGGFFLGPIYYYFMAPFLWLFNYDPVGPAVMIGLLGVATVYLVYKIGSEFFDKKAGVAAAVLYTFSPLVIGYSRSSWNPNPMPFFTLLTLYVLYKALRKRSVFLFIICGLLYGIDMQLHYIEAFTGVIMIVYIFLHESFFVVQEKSITKIVTDALEKYAYVFLGFFAGISPFLAFEVRHGFPDAKSLTNFIFHSSDTGANVRFFNIIGDVAFRLFGRLIIKFPPPEQISLNNSQLNVDFVFFNFNIPISILYLFTLFILVAGVSRLAYLIFHEFKNRKLNDSKMLLLGLWLLIGVVLFGFYKKPIYDYYFEFMFPLPFLIVGGLFSFAYLKSKITKWGAIIILLFLVMLNASGVPFRYPANRQLYQVKTISQFIFNKVDHTPYNFALGSEGNSDHAYRYFLTLWGNPPVEINHIGEKSDTETITNQLYVVCERGICHPLGDPRWEIAGFGRAEIANTWDVSVVKVYKLVRFRGQ